jgi:HD-like signal output (HDOD) protein
VPNQRVFEIELARTGAFANQPSQFELVRDLPDVPVLSETLLLMELMVSERSVDLREISQLILSDLGATVQILRLSACDFSSIEELPTRIEDCISGLGVQACLEAMSRRIVKRSASRSEIIETWAHARNMAEACRALAGEFAVNPEDAYMVGLFHVIGSLPSVLGWWQTPPIAGHPDAVGQRMAQAWSLPRCVAQYFAPQRSTAGQNRWRELVQLAHHGSAALHPACMPQEGVPLHRSLGALAHAFSS